MHFSEISLKNIRTYNEETITFPKANVLLSGDIGSGKSSILLAIEFALFGIMRGELSGESLLKKGSSDGSVELTFHCQNKEICIKRTLRRSDRGVQQTAGHLIVDGVKEEGTPIELKAKILQLLGYPDTMLTSSKSLMYRYTVYTPQEDMKRIIQDEGEVRLDVLRKVFNMDKYKRIKENLQSYLQTLREDILKGEAKSELLPQQEKDYQELQEQHLLLQKEWEVFMPREQELQKKKLEAKQRLRLLEEETRRLDVLKKELGLSERELLSTRTQGKEEEASLLVLKKKRDMVREQLSMVPEQQEVKERADQLQKAITLLEREQQEAVAKQAALKTQMGISESLKQQLHGLTTCPTCLQAVAESHKVMMLEKEEEKVAALQKKIAMVHIEHIQQQLHEKKEQFTRIQAQVQKEELIIFQRASLEESIHSIRQGEEKIEKLQEQAAYLEKKRLALEKNIREEAPAEAKYQEQKVFYEVILEEEKELAAKLASLKTSRHHLSTAMTSVEQSIKALKELSGFIKKKKDLQTWLKDHFMNLVGVMEKHVLLRIQQEFNHLFQDWFLFMLEDEQMSARLDENFAPVIEQNGYEIEFMNLSGGEKTSVALAYRLALNKVVSELNTIHTKDVLILDEPTDGFSSEQLDKLKEVLLQLDMQQIIIVSHEPKVESFVEHIIRVQKQGGVSSIVS